MQPPATPVFANLLRDHRLAAGLTQEALAERAGVSVRNIQNLERGANMPHKDTALRLVEALPLGERERALILATVLPIPRRRGVLPGPSRPDDGETSPTTGLLAVLVTDVRGYTAFTHAHGDEAGARLAARFAVLAGEAVTAEDGHVVEVRGDEVLAVFGSARAALRAATGILARCAEEASEALPLRAGIGLDVGEPVQVPGGYRGEVVNTAARLCAQAGPGEVLASEALVALARKVEGLAYQERGQLHLKGLSRPVRAWLVRQGEVDPGSAGLAGLAVTTSAHMTPARRALPAPVSSFIGRAREREDVLGLLADHRLVTLTGVGGVGKTRLALQVAGQAPAEIADDVIFVSLGAIGDADLVGPAIAEALGVEAVGEASTNTLIASFLIARPLLVLDNFEQVIGAAPLVASLLAACPGLKVLVTSRVCVHLSGEQEYAVPPLTLPADDPRATSDPARVGESPAVALFVERARLVNPDFALSAENSPDVAAICRALDGLPLAIELAAARMRHLGVHTLLGRLDNRLAVLTGGPRDQPARQQTLRNTIAWSHDLLEAGEQRLFRRLAVFVGGWTLEAAEAVAADDSDDQEMLDALTTLLDNNLLILEPRESRGDRFGILETIHEFALECLEESGETAALRERHAAYYLAFAEGIAADTAATDLAREQDNLRAALRWAKANQRIDLSLGLSAALWRLWHARGFPWEEGGSG